jgi:outer membrane protein assembly factor BamB
MDASDLIFLGLKSRVSALTKNDGRILWATVLDGGVGDGFVTLNCDGKFVYAHTKGKIHCLDYLSGQKLWTNELPGYGYGIASICLADLPTAPHPEVYAKIAADRASQAAAVAAT